MNAFLAAHLDSTFGLLLQLGVALLLTTLFLAARHGGRAGGAGWLWNLVWLVQAFAISVLVFRFILLPNLDQLLLQDDSVTTHLLYRCYGVAKVVFFTLIGAGAVLLRGPRHQHVFLAVLLGAAVIQGVGMAVLSTDLVRPVGLNAPFAVGCELLGAWMLLRHGSERGAAGAGLGAVALVAMAAIAVADMEIFRPLAPGTVEGVTGIRLALHRGNVLLNYNSYIDTAAHLVLATAMLRLIRASSHPPRQAPLIPST